MAMPRLLTVLLVATWLSPGVHAQTRLYEPVVLPVPPGCQSFTVLHGLDDQVRVSGFVSCDDFRTHQAAVWEDGQLVTLGTFGGPSSMALDSNARGIVVGTAETSDPYPEGYFVGRPFRWDGKSLQDLGTLGGRLGAALAINEQGTIVGACEPPQHDPRLGRVPMRACVWEQGEVWDLGDLGGPEAVAYDINARGWIVGDADTAEPLDQVDGFVRHAFLHDGRTMLDLGTLGGLASLAWAVNDQGDAVGVSLTGTRGPTGVHEQRAVLWRRGMVHDLGTLGGELSEARGINNGGVIVGWSWRVLASGARHTRATVWIDGVPFDLNDRVPGQDDWVFSEATAINERGAIVVNGRRPGPMGSRVILLVPKAEE